MLDIQSQKPFPILAAKLTIPLVPAALVSRDRLLKKMDAGFRQKNIILLSAPAGFGKTTLLTEWCNQCGSPVAWLTLDENDSDLMRFLTHIVYAISYIVNDFEKKVLPLLLPPSKPTREMMLAIFINVLAEKTPEMVLVLDNLHLVENQSVHEFLQRISENLPQKVHLILASREDPKFPLGRLRTSQRLIEIRADDLRFLTEECVVLMNKLDCTHLSIEEMEVITQRTEGWAAGLQMAALSLKNHPNPARFIQDFSGSNRYIMDYLVGEVWQRLTAEMQSFILQTSFLTRMNASLCEALTSRKDSQRILEDLERANLFVTALDDERDWYRYHHLFADLLQKKLVSEFPSRLPELQKTASEWFSAHEDLGEAIQLALAAKEYPQAAGLVQRHAVSTLMHSQISTLEKWVDSIPADTLLGYPLLRVYHAWARFILARPGAEIEACLFGIDENALDEQTLGGLIALRGMIAVMGGDIKRGIEFSEQALKILPPESLFIKSMMIDNLGILHLLRGDYHTAIQYFEEAMLIGEQTKNTLITVAALSNIAGIYLLQGKLKDAAKLFQKALDQSQHAPGEYLPIACKPLIGLGEIEREWNELEKAENTLKKGLALTRYYGEIGAVMAYVSLGRIREARGDFLGAEELMLKAEQIAKQFEATKMDDRIVAGYRSHLWLRMGQIDRASTWLQNTQRALDRMRALRRANENFPTPGEPTLSFDAITLARFEIKQGKYEEALELLEEIETIENQVNRHRSQVKILLLKTIALNGMGEKSRASETFHHALILGEKESCLRSFLDEAEDIQPMLASLRTKQNPSVFLSSLLQAYLPEEEPMFREKNFSYNLTRRELDVLELMAQGYTNKQIATRLFLALDTVKGHTRNIFAKLNVKNRVQAIKTAHEENLLS